MLITIVGEHCTGKSRYLRYLKDTSDRDSIIFDRYDNSYKEHMLDMHFIESMEANVENGCANIDGIDIAPLDDVLCREADVYLLDEPEANTPDAYELIEIIVERSRNKDVIVVTYDSRLVGAANNIYVVKWVGELPVAIEVSIYDTDDILLGY